MDRRSFLFAQVTDPARQNLIGEFVSDKLIEKELGERGVI
jgi:hypothetical protein